MPAKKMMKLYKGLPSLILTLYKNAYSAYLSGDVLQKRTLLKLVSSHFLWDGENLTIIIKEAFQPIVEIASLINGGREETRTPTPKAPVPKTGASTIPPLVRAFNIPQTSR